jgi:hypothetical protein
MNCPYQTDKSFGVGWVSFFNPTFLGCWCVSWVLLRATQPTNFLYESGGLLMIMRGKYSGNYLDSAIFLNN